jgi:hypothetical protein
MVHGNYLTTPEFVWNIPLTDSLNGNVAQQGNAIVPIRQRNLLAITTSTGTLHLVSTKDAAVTANGTTIDNNRTATTAQSYIPNAMNGMDGIVCRGGIIAVVESSISSSSVSSDNDDTFIVVYAVTDTDSQGRLLSTSRILAIDTTTAELVWNITVSGTIVGTPIVSTSNNVMYVVHNVVASSSTTTQSSSLSGQVSIFQFHRDPQNVFTNKKDNTSTTTTRPTLITTLPTESTGQPFGPASVITNTNDGKDYLFFAEDFDDSSGETFMDSMFVISGSNTDDFVFSVASSRVTGTNTAPTLRDNNGVLEVFLGQPSSSLIGWVDNNATLLLSGLMDGNRSTSSSAIDPSWELQTAPDFNNEIAGTY